MISEQAVIDILYFILQQVVQDAMLCTFFILMLTPKYNRVLTVLCFIAVEIAVKFIVMTFLGDHIIVKFVLNIIVIFIFPVLVFFSDKLKLKMFAAFIFALYEILIDITVSTWSMASLGYYASKIYPLTWVSVAAMLLADTMFLVGAVPIVILWRKKIRKYNLKSIGLFILFPIGQTVFISACTYPTWVSGSDFKVFDNPFMLLALIISIISDVLMFVALRDNDNLQRTRGQISEMEKQMELQLQYYDNLADKFTEIREYRHDINNLVSVAEALINDTSSESSKAFIGEMKEKALKMKVPMFCENSIVNAILWKKQSEALEKGLEFTAAVDRTEKFPLDRIDVCSLLANLLDNAIREAAEQPDGFVRVIIGRKHGLLIIDVSNSTAREYSAAERLPKTTKNGDHGHGMEIADKISRKYNGKFVFKAEGGTAHAIVSLLTGEETR